jgi:hypothetical protein
MPLSFMAAAQYRNSKEYGFGGNFFSILYGSLKL